MNPKSFYHALVPAAVRYPIGRFRRGVMDRGRRWLTAGPLPPRRLLDRVQMTPWIDEYLRVGQISASTLTGALGDAGLPADAEVLDFGCGLGRTLRWLDGRSSWRLHGCDVDPDQVAWCRSAFASIDVRVNAPMPPLPWADAHFDGLWAVSVFTHFSRDEQRAWAAEVARVLRPGGFAAITTMGPRALGNFAQLATPERRQTLEREGFVFHRGGDAFNARGAFHTEAGVEATFSRDFELRQWIDGGLDGFQDLSILRRRLAPGSSVTAADDGVGDPSQQAEVDHDR